MIFFSLLNFTALGFALDVNAACTAAIRVCVQRPISPRHPLALGLLRRHLTWSLLSVEAALC